MRVGPVTELRLPMYCGVQEAGAELHARRGIDLGSGVYAMPYHLFGDTDESPDAGVNVGHYHEDGSWCEGGVAFRDFLEGRPIWQVHAWDPLTITPSVHNVECGLHGWITDGRWVGC